MPFTTILFYLFSFILLSSSLVVVSTRNSVYSVMFLILAFFNAAALFILLGAEFLAMLLVVVYVGAIAVLFLFVVMMLNVDSSMIKEKAWRYAPLLICLALIFFTEIFLILKASNTYPYTKISLFPILPEIQNTKAIGNILYTDFVLPFQLAGCVLFVAMIGAIVLTLKANKRFIRKQNITNQVLRNKANSLEIVKIKPNEGINI